MCVCIMYYIIYIWIYMYIHFFKKFSFPLWFFFYHRILNIDLCAIREDLVVYLLYIWKFTSANPNSIPSLTLWHMVTTSLFSMSIILFLVRLCAILDSTCKWHHMVFVFLFPNLVWYSLVASILLHMALFCSFLWQSSIPLYIWTMSSLSILL